MKKTNRLQNWLRVVTGAVVLLAVLAVGLDMSTFASLADSAGKVTASSAKIRKEPSTSSDTVGSAVKDAEVKITGQTTGGDGYTWYKVSVDGGIVGYIRSDLMEITDGSTPATIVPSTTSPSSSTPTTSTPDEELVDVAEVEPVSASVSSSSPVRVRQNASTTSRIVTTAQSGLALTVVGQATGTDNKDWYQVSFISNGSEVSGFIRADYVSVKGDLVPAGTTQEPEVQEPEDTEEPATETKDWDTYYDTKWHLVDNTTGNSYDIEQIFSSVEANTQTLQDTLSENKTQQIVIIILVILVIGLATGISFLIFKIKDMSDSAYFNQVEQETIRRRNADRPASKPQNGQRVMQTVGAEGAKRPASGTAQRPAGSQGGQRPAGQRPAGSQGGQRPAGQRPASSQGGQRPAGQRPAGNQGAQRPAGQRPAGNQGGQRPAGQRPAGNQGAQRPAGQRPAGTQSGQRPAGQPAQRPAGSAQPSVRQRPVEVQEPVQEVAQDVVTDDTIVYQAASVQNAVAAQPAENAGWQSKNFANEEEFEFQFLDWNEEEQ